MQTTPDPKIPGAKTIARAAAIAAVMGTRKRTKRQPAVAEPTGPVPARDDVERWAAIKAAPIRELSGDQALWSGRWVEWQAARGLAVYRQAEDQRPEGAETACACLQVVGVVGDHVGDHLDDRGWWHALFVCFRGPD